MSKNSFGNQKHCKVVNGIIYFGYGKDTTETTETIELTERNDMNIQEIAKLANVSVSTVSKVMNRKDKDISEKTKNKVLKVIEDNNYIPYAKYRVKEGLINRFIGLVIQKGNPFYKELVSTVEKVLRNQGFYLVVLTIGTELEEIDNALNELQKRGVMGALVDASRAASRNREECKLVYLTDTSSFERRQKNIFYYRKCEAGRLAVKALLEAGHQKISVIIREREKTVLDGVEAVYGEQNLQKQFLTSYIGTDLEDIRQNALVSCISDNISAVICGDMEIAGCVLEYAKQIGIKIPEELSVICTRDHAVLEYLAGGISAVRYPIQEMAEDGVKYLLQMILEGKESEITRRFSLSIVERNSIWDVKQQPTGEKIVVVGSMNIDNSIEGARIPANGETLIATDILTMPGGKGANQAVGVGRLGGEAYMIGRIGKDADGRMLHKSLTDNGVHMDGVEFDEQAASGKAFVHIDRDGENAIVVYRGANGNLDEAQLRRHEDIFRTAKYCLLSSEISKEAMSVAKKSCQENGTEVVLKPSGLEDVGEEVLAGIDYLVPNEKEMAQIYQGEALTLEEKAEKLMQIGVRNVIVTLGKRGAYLRNKEYSLYFTGAPFTPIDTTGGADSFISAMVVALSEGKDLIYSIIYATYAAGITITRYGVQEALPDKKTIYIYREEIEKQYIEKKKEGKG